jgi:cysteine-rich repeat protein
VLLIGCGTADNTNDVGTEQDAYRAGRNRNQGHGANQRQGQGMSHRGHGNGHGNGHGHGHGHGDGDECDPDSPGSSSGGTSSVGGGSSNAGSSNGSAGTAGGSSPGSGGAAGGPPSGSGGFAGFGGSQPVVCGDGIVWWPEQCDDGNTESGDGCTSSCVTEPGYFCRYDYETNEYSCSLAECGNGLMESYANGDGTFGWENCDDGNTESDDGCTDACDLETGFVCEVPGSACREVVCGDGIADWYFVPGDGSGTGGTGFGGAAGSGGSSGYWVFEQCDDSNATSGDGCNATCEVEPGYVCDVPGGPCRQPVCGDSHQDWVGSGGIGGAGGSAGSAGSTGYFEGCDDGNVASGDGCSESCELEPGYICNPPGTPCRQPVCGDGYQDWIDTGSGGAGPGTGGSAGSGSTGYFEGCDDGNMSSGDGCDGSCELEPGYYCNVPGTPCQLAVCGNGIVEWPAEDCDTGPDVPGDECANCRWDPNYTGSGGFGSGGFGTGAFGTGGASGEPGGG